MKRLLVAVATLACAAALSAHAAEGTGKGKATPEAKALKKEMLEKYDTNKDGKLDKEERAKISKEDQTKLTDAGLAPKKAKKGNKDSKDK